MKKKTVAVMCMMALFLTACGGDFPSLSDEEAATIGEYAAITLLKYDANSRSRLVDLSQVEEEPTVENELKQPEQKPEMVVPEQPKEPEPQKPEKQEESVDTAEGQETAESIEHFLELPEGVTVSYVGYDLCQSYQEDDSIYFALEASEGKTLLVTRFVMQNLSSVKQDINLLDRRDNYRLTVNETYSRTALTTMLTNDMSTYKGSIEAGASEEVVLLIEVESEEEVQSISLNLKNESKTYTIQLL